MQFESLSDFFAMGGYAFYVWISFFVTFSSMAIIAIQSYMKQKSLLSTTLKEQERRARIKRAQQNIQS